MYSKKSFSNGNHLSIFLILSSLNNVSFVSHAPPYRFNCMTILSSGIFLLGSPNSVAANFIRKLISLSVTSPLPTLSQYAHKSVVPSDVCTRICATRLDSAFTGYTNICSYNAPWCTHAPLNEVFCSVIRNSTATDANSSCLLVLRGGGGG